MGEEEEEREIRKKGVGKGLKRGGRGIEGGRGRGMGERLTWD